MSTQFGLRLRLEQLEPSLRVAYLARLCDHALPAILGYFSVASRRQYRDSVVGMSHPLDVTLPRRSVDALLSTSLAERSGVVRGLLTEYREPIAALQDLDLEIAEEPAELAYYSVYNLLRLAENPQDTELALRLASQALSGIFPELLSGKTSVQRVDAFLESWWTTCEQQHGA